MDHLIERLADALFDEDIESARAILAEGCDVNGYYTSRNGRVLTPAIIAANHPTLLTMLIAHHADINMPSLDQEQETPLLAAGKNDNLETVQILLANNADLELVDTFGNTVLSQLCWNYNEDSSPVLKLLLAAGANTNHTTISHATPLMYLARCKNINSVSGAPDKINYQSAVTLLLDHGADITLKDAAGKSALDYLPKYAPPALVELLKTAHEKYLLWNCIDDSLAPASPIEFPRI